MAVATTRPLDNTLVRSIAVFLGATGASRTRGSGDFLWSGSDESESFGETGLSPSDSSGTSGSCPRDAFSCSS